MMWQVANMADNEGHNKKKSKGRKSTDASNEAGAITLLHC